MSAAFLMGAASYIAMSGPAAAADLGGDCCSDLEERVAELEATTARKGNRKVSLTLYGQVNTGVLHFDNGEDSDTYIVDNQTSGSRFGFKGDARINANLSAGFWLEVSALSAPSNTVTEDDDDGGVANDGALAIRQANWYLSHKRLGRVTVGRLSMATDGISEIDLGGANIVAQSGLYYGNDIAVGGLGGVNFDAFARGNFEFDRNNAVRYDTATVGGFTASTAFGEDDRWDVALRYAGEHHGFRVAAGIGYGIGTDPDSDGVGAVIDERRILAGSLSVLHVGTGLFASGSYAQRETEYVAALDSDTDEYWSVRGGITKNWFGIGKTVLYGEYHNWENETAVANAAVANADIWGAGVVQNIDAAAMELFVAYKNHSVDLNNTDETHLLLSGARIRF